MDYGYPERRRNRNDRKAKRKFNIYRKGGKNRAEELSNILTSGEKTAAAKV